MRMHHHDDKNTSKDFSLFLSHTPPKRNNSVQGYTRPSKRAYRGAIYSLSTPSPSSPTIYAGVSNGVCRLDFVSTDDLTIGQWYRQNTSLNILGNCQTASREASYGMVNLSGYERPEPWDYTSSLSPLRDQRPFSSLVYSDEEHRQVLNTGWDQRWEEVRKSPLRSYVEGYYV